MNSQQLEDALTLLKREPLPSDTIEQLEVLAEQAPASEQDKFDDLMETALMELGPIIPPEPEE